MFSRRFLLVSSFAAAALSTGAGVQSADAAPRDKAFFQSISGTWSGPGEIVAGKYKGTKFTCNLTGKPSDGGNAGVKLDGTCRVGVFQQPMSAEITQNGGSYSGKFLDGAAGKGLDVTSGTVNDNTVVLGLIRQKLNGAMIARVSDNKSMNVTISVKVGEQMVPVIGVTLKRADVDQMAVGSIQ
ncbi:MULTISPECIES: hypothetical protein [Rhizobium]|uniref:Uncharacterized protein n=1 Tax=Rhizobium tropici TaxID=398 RepID=A0A329YNW8_RHITR|nr:MULTISPECIES: hypothetical protein [Rhizobium]MDK4723571.1 hypothetical protein [Rhizobium sp. CNPSo 3968]RAX43405.1 hypothetical protein DQ393_01100 [Rhizobium tropici]